jgi:ATP-dependent DNA helicase RecG
MKYPEIESYFVELKRELPNTNDPIIKTIIGFCNQHGGQLVIGVADNGDIVGLDENEIEDAMESLDKALFDACEPHVIPRIYSKRFEDKRVLVVEVSEGMNKPYFRRSEGLEKGTYIRLGRHTLRATSGIIQELQWQSKGVDFESLPVHRATVDDLDKNTIKAFLENRKNHGKLEYSQQTLHAYNLVTFEHSKIYPTIAGIFLFGREPQKYFSEAMLICTHFQGTSGREAIASIDCEGTLFDQFKQAYSFITHRLYRAFSIKKLKRDEQLEIPEVAIREALLNMIVHRNYYIKAPSKIAIYDDRVEFYSPGQFPGPMNINNLCAGITYLRNPIICKIMREANYIEKLGTGFITIFKSYEECGLKTPQIIEGENYIKCILPRKDAIQKNEKLDDEARLLVLFKTHREMTVGDVMHHLTVSRATAVRRLNELLSKGAIVRIGRTKSIRYRLVPNKI